MTTAKNKSEVKVGKHTVNITNRQKIYWPDEGYTKGDMIDYYDKMADLILPHLRGRPLSLKRNGMGLGLTVSFSILQSHKAKIRANSKENEGTEFQISFNK